ncbi:hypothetical protein, partial [Ralstonia sp.]|uniref:hypothetical protein n=1 Tax=Ralstonia sp. TaxID=54061 RepID=UPI0025E09623
CRYSGAQRTRGGESGGHLHQWRWSVPVGTGEGSSAKALREAAEETRARWQIWQDHVGNRGCVGRISPSLHEKAVSET